MQTRPRDDERTEYFPPIASQPMDGARHRLAENGCLGALRRRDTLTRGPSVVRRAGSREHVRHDVSLFGVARSIGQHLRRDPDLLDSSGECSRARAAGSRAVRAVAARRTRSRHCGERVRLLESHLGHHRTQREIQHQINRCRSVERFTRCATTTGTGR